MAETLSLPKKVSQLQERQQALMQELAALQEPDTLNRMAPADVADVAGLVSRHIRLHTRHGDLEGEALELLAQSANVGADVTELVMKCIGRQLEQFQTISLLERQIQQQRTTIESLSKICTDMATVNARLAKASESFDRRLDFLEGPQSSLNQTHQNPFQAVFCLGATRVSGCILTGKTEAPKNRLDGTLEDQRSRWQWLLRGGIRYDSVPCNCGWQPELGAHPLSQDEVASCTRISQRAWSRGHGLVARKLVLHQYRLRPAELPGILTKSRL